MNKRVIVRIKGGIGNQLFCYAAARRLAFVNNAELINDNISGFIYDHDFKRQYELDKFNINCRKATPIERLEPLSKLRRFLLRTINSHRSFVDRTYIQQKHIDFDPRLLQVKVRGKLYLDGYWQSEDYFKDIEDMIRFDLRINPPTDVTNQELAKRINNCIAVAVHIRFFKMLSKECSNNISNDYYSRAITYIERDIPDAFYFIFSNDPAAARRLIPIPNTRYICVSHNQGNANDYKDLWLITQCKHFIIANSTFSWWGAWLSENKGKIIIAPANKINGIGTWGFEGLIPDGWLKL